MGSCSSPGCLAALTPSRRLLASFGSIAIVVASAVVLLVALALDRRTTPEPAARPAVPASAQPPLSAPTASASDEPAPAKADPEACAIADRGNGSYSERALGVGDARLFLPDPLPPDAELRVLLHFHGGEPVRRLLAPEALALAFATVDAGIGSRRYAAVLAPAVLDKLMAAIARELGGRSTWRRSLIVSAWSAGYGAVRELLLQAPDVPRAVVLLDALHTSYRDSGSMDEALLEPFFALARRAQGGAALLWLTHSAITPPGYASTSEVAAALIRHVGGRRYYAGLVPQFGIELKTRFDRGDLHVRGYTGNDKAAHCAHLKLLPAIIKNDVLVYLSRN